MTTGVPQLMTVCSVTDGDGVNSAMYDAYQLSQQIVAHGLDGLDAAVVSYENLMFPRSRQRLSQAIVSLQHMFSQDAIQALMGEGGA